MILAKVKERVVSTAQLDHLPARPFLTVTAMPGFGDPHVPLIAIDSVGAGPGDLVLVMAEGTGARQALSLADEQALAAQMVIIAVVDAVEGMQVTGNA